MANHTIPEMWAGGTSKSYRRTSATITDSDMTVASIATWTRRRFRPLDINTRRMPGLGFFSGACLAVTSPSPEDRSGPTPGDTLASQGSRRHHAGGRGRLLMRSMVTRPSLRSRSARRVVLLVATAAAAVAAAFAPASLTGSSPVDVVERALLAGACTYVGAYGRRWAWVVAGALFVAPARGPALVIGLIGLCAIVLAAGAGRRSKSTGAIGLAVLVNVPFWYPADVHPVAPLLALAGYLLLLESGRRMMRHGPRRILVGTLAGVVAFVLLAGAASLLSFGLARTSVTRGSDQAQIALDAARSGNS